MSNADNSMTDFNWNPTPEDSDVIQYHITNFKLTRSDGEMNSLLIEQSGVDEQFFQLQGDLVSCTNPTFKKRFEVLVKQYFIDLGVPSNPGEPNPTRGFWMVGKDPDCHFRLVLPADAEFRDHANVVDLPDNIRLLRRYQFPFNAAYCLHLSKFSLTDRDMGGHQTPILSASNKMLLALRGVISVNDETNKLPAVFPNYGDLRIQTYVQNKYAIDLGADPFVLRPEFCLEDCHGTWIRLTLPPHVTYRADFTNTLMRTVDHMAAYNLPSERGETWRHVTNYRLTDKMGDLHSLEIAHLNTEFTLWAELVPPPRASCPPIQILLQVNSYAIDTGRSLYDTDKGVWMQDLRGDWYKLGDPAPEYRTIADPLLEKAAQYIRFHDALVFQDRSAEVSLYLQNKGKYLSNWKLTAVHQKANPKFELYFIQQNKAFVIQHLEADFDATGSCFLMASINELTGVKPPVRADAPANGGPSKLNGDNGASTGRLRSITNDTAKEASGLSDSDNDVPLRRSKHLRSRDGSTGSESKRQRSNSENDVAAAAPRRITKKTIAVEEDEDSPAEPSKPVVAAMGAPPSSQVSRNGGGGGGSGSQAPTQRLELPNAAKPSTTSVAAPSMVPPVPAKPRMNRFADADDELPGHMPPPPPKERLLQRSVFDEPSFYGATASSAASKPPLPVAPPPPVVAPPQIPPAKPPVPSLPKPTSKEDFTKTLQAYMQASAHKPVEAPAPQSRVAPPPPFPPRASTGNVVPPNSGASVYQPPHRAAAPAPPAPPQQQPQENTAASGMARWEAYSRQTTGVAVTALASRNTQPEPAMLNVMRTASGSQPEDNAGRRVDPRGRPSRWDADAVVAPSIKAIEPIPAGGGRGRGATLPAWYTAQTDRNTRVDPRDAPPKPPDNASRRVDPPDRPFRSDAAPMSVPAVIGIDPIPPGGGRGRGATLPAWVTEQRKHDAIVMPSDRNDRRAEHASQFQDAPRTAGVDQYGRQDQISVFSTDTRRDDAGRPKGILKSASQYPDQPGATSRERSYERDNQYTGWRQPPQGELRPLQVQQVQQDRRSRSRSRERSDPNRALAKSDYRRRSYPQDLARDRGSGNGSGNGGGVWRGEQDGRYGRSSGDDSYRSGPSRGALGGNRDPYASSAPRVVEEDVGDFRGGRRTAPRPPDRAVTEPFPARNRGAEDGFGRALVEQSQSTISGFPQQSMTAPPPQRAAPSTQSAPSTNTGSNAKPAKTRVDCSQCRGITKKPTCTNDAHINGQQVRVSLATAAPPAVPPAAADPPRRQQQQHMRETPELDVEVGIDSTAANSDAAFAFLNMVQTLTVDPNGGVINLDVSSDEATTRKIVSSALVDLHSSPVPSPVSSPKLGANPVVPVFRSDEEVQSNMSGSRGTQSADNKQPQDSLRVQTTDGTASAGADHRAEPASPARKDELSAERARYLRTKQHHSAESASEDGDKNKGKPGVIVSPRHGVWGRGIALPKADSAAPPVAVFKLGGRQDDPKKRLEQTRRNSLGVYATTSAENMGERHAPPSTSARPTKSAMRSTSNNGSNGGNGGSGSDDNRSAAGSSTGSAVAKPVKWRDMEGGSALYVRHSYETENDVSSEGLAN